MKDNKSREEELDKTWKEYREYQGKEKEKKKQKKFAIKKYVALKEKRKSAAGDLKLLKYIQQVKNHLWKNILDDDGTPAFWFE
jgi:hypothetical protein